VSPRTIKQRLSASRPSQGPDYTHFVTKLQRRVRTPLARGGSPPSGVVIQCNLFRECRSNTLGGRGPFTAAGAGLVQSRCPPAASRGRALSVLPQLPTTAGKSLSALRRSSATKISLAICTLRSSAHASVSDGAEVFLSVAGLAITNGASERISYRLATVHAFAALPVGVNANLQPATPAFRVS
jgi:hypothetical protein